MKLWVKIALACTGVLILIVCIVSTLLLVQTNSSMMTQMRQSTQAQLNSLSESVSSMVNFYGEESLEPIAKRALIKDAFSRFADEYFVLISETEVLYSKVLIEPEKLVSSELYYEGSADGSEVLIYGEKVNFLGESYMIYIVKDLSGIYSVINRSIWEFLFISIGCILFGILCIILLTRLFTKPLKKLSKATSSIAKGDYTIRADVRLKDEVGDLARDFNGMADAIETHVAELKETAERQRLFIGDLTHEFKTPMTSILMYSETLLNTKLTEEDSKRALSYIHEQCKWLEQLTQKMLKLITLREEIRLQNEPVDTLIDLVCSGVKAPLNDQDIKLEASCSANELPMDMDLMKSALVNLVMNAANASKPGQTVHLCAYERTIEVMDKGVGIAQDEIDRITQPFYMTDRSRSKAKGGSGLGLALAAQIAAAHGAELVIGSEIGKGTTVKVIFG